MTAFEALKRAGFLFMDGVPPKSEDGVLILDTGGCNAQVARWEGDRLIEWSHGEEMVEIEASGVYAWMRLPNSSWWPEVEAPANPLQSEEKLFGGPDYNAKRAAFRQALEGTA